MIISPLTMYRSEKKTFSRRFHSSSHGYIRLEEKQPFLHGPISRGDKKIFKQKVII